MSAERKAAQQAEAERQHQCGLLAMTPDAPRVVECRDPKVLENEWHTKSLSFSDFRIGPGPDRPEAHQN